MHFNETIAAYYIDSALLSKILKRYSKICFNLFFNDFDPTNGDVCENLPNGRSHIDRSFLLQLTSSQ